MSERSPLYVPVNNPDGYSSWTTRFRLPKVLAPKTVMAEIHRGVQAMKYSPDIPLDTIAKHGLTGVLVGPEGDNDARRVRDVIFTTDPSRTYGQRPTPESDVHAVRLAEVNGWTEVDVYGHEVPEDDDDWITAHGALGGLVRVIMGRNKDKYGGTAAFTFQEARDLLGPDTRFTTYGGHLFSDRPGWQRPYGEPALVVQMDAAAYDTTAQQELFSLAYGLNAQHRFNLETPHGPQAFELNTPIL